MRKLEIKQIIMKYGIMECDTNQIKRKSGARWI